MKLHKHNRSAELHGAVLSEEKFTCTATVLQVEDVFTPDSNAHIHPAEPGLDIKVKITKKVHGYSKQNIFRFASAIVDVMSSDIHLDTLSISRPIPANLMRSCNYQRHRNRPTELQDISFVLDYNWIHQEFVQGDIKIAGARHIVFATLPQLQLLNNASVIYCDATFKVVRQPFSQLFSFHSFLGDANNENVKQVPLAFIMMSRRPKRDYKALFKHMKEIIPIMNRIRRITDFEAAIWHGASKIFPNIVGVTSIGDKLYGEKFRNWG